MKQEDLNEIMRYPGERKPKKANDWSRCPLCGENYCGNGKELCLECKALEETK